VNQIDLTEKEQQIAQLLLDYMKKHPNAKHTAEGIARWWILQQKLDEEQFLVERVIEHFSEKGILEKVQLADGNCYFRFHQQKLTEMLDVHSIVD